MAYNIQRANWKDPELLKIFLDACIEVDTSVKRKGGSFKKQSWDIIGKSIREKKGLTLSHKQIKNQWDYMKRKYSIWEKLVNKSGDGYDPISNTISWTTEEWDEYIKIWSNFYEVWGNIRTELDRQNEELDHYIKIQAFPDAKQFRYAGLQYANLMKSLFDGTGATGKDPIIHADPITAIPSSLASPVELSKSKRRKTNTDENESESIDDQSKNVVKTLKEPEEPSFEDCYKVLNDLLDEGDPLYIVACAIFCENKMYKQVWMTLTRNSDYVRKNWLTMVGKRFGLIS